MVLQKVKADGLMTTIDAVRRKLTEPVPLGYCNVGVVEEVGAGITAFAPGDRVVSNGSHAEFVVVPEQLCARIPAGVTDDEAAFTVVGAIGLQGIRLVEPTFGETIVVVGLGLIGLLTVQLLRASGCRVIGIEPDPRKRAIAEGFGVLAIAPHNAVASVAEATGQIGADGVIITASAKTNAIVSDAANMSRKRGRIVLVGVVGLDLARSEFYEKELSFQVSCSYGPGRYDPAYEQKGLDYPIGFVRWTEQRNFQAILNSLERRQIDVAPLLSETVPIDQMTEVYANIAASEKIATVFKYSEFASTQRTVEVTPQAGPLSPGSWGVIGAGNFTKMVVMPAIARTDATVRWLVSAKGVSSTNLAAEYGVMYSTSDYREMLKDPSVGTVIVTTQHDTHHHFAKEALRAGKDVFVEKPLVLNREDLADLRETRAETGRNLTVGFNRRFSRHSVAVKQALSDAVPKNMIATVNAGTIPPDVWVHDMESGGGRIVGEACHFIDLLRFFSGSPIVGVCTNALGQHPGLDTDNASIILRFANGDQGTVCYFANGAKSFPKERIEIFAANRIYQIDNFRRTRAYGDPGFKTVKTKLDKGHAAQFRLLHERQIEGDGALIPFEEVANVTEASFAALESLSGRQWVSI